MLVNLSLSPTSKLFLTFRDLFRQIETKTNRWRVGFRKSPTIYQVTLSSFKFGLLSSEVNCFRTLRKLL